jgi:hypothetical protein
MFFFFDSSQGGSSDPASCNIAFGGANDCYRPSGNTPVRAFVNIFTEACTRGQTVVSPLFPFFLSFFFAFLLSSIYYILLHYRDLEL